MATTQSALSREQEALVVKYMPLAKKIAWQTCQGLPIEYEDAKQVAYIGLMQAAVKYDNKQEFKQSKFESFAWFRIRGAIIDEVRKRSMVTRTQVAKGERAMMVSLNDTWESGDPKLFLEAPLEDLDFMLDITAAMKKLTERERHVMTALVEGMRMREIGIELGLTESRVSQIATSARTKLKELLAA